MYREKDPDNKVDETAWSLVFKAGIYTSWLNNKGDKIRNIGAGSFPYEYLEDNTETFKKFVELGGQGIQGALAMNCGPTAQLIASLVEKPEAINFIGMDIYSNNDSVNNVYK